jgi:hypothetical protein
MAGHIARVGNEINTRSLYSFFWAVKMEQRVPKRRHIKFRRQGPPKERIQHSVHIDSLKSGKYMVLCGKE